MAVDSCVGALADLRKGTRGIYMRWDGHGREWERQALGRGVGVGMGPQSPRYSFQRQS